MTKISFTWLLNFLNVYGVNFKPDFRVADYGGTEKLNARVVKKALKNGGLKDYTMLDYDSGIDLLKPIPKKYGKFDIGICMDLLEHVTNPFLVTDNIKASLKPGGLLFVTAPMVWEEHDYPGDYWRYMPQGFRILFSDMKELELGIVRDEDKGEFLPRSRIVGVFKKL